MRFFLMAVLLSFSCVCAHATESVTSDTADINKLLKRSLSYQRTNIDSCFWFARIAYQLSEQTGYLKGKGVACIRMGSAVLTRGDYDSAQQYLYEALITSEKTCDKRGAAGAFLLLSYVYQGKGLKDSAISVLYKSLRYTEAVKDTSLTILNYNALGDVFEEYEDFELATLQYKKAMKWAAHPGYLNEYTGALFGIAALQYKRGNIQVALQYYQQLDSLCRQFGDEIGVAQNLNNLALCYADLGKVTKAITCYADALYYYRQAGLSSEEANALYNLADLHKTQNNPDSALYYLHQSLSIAYQIGEPDERADCYAMLAEMYARKNQFQMAYEYHAKYTSLSDSLMNIEKIKSINEMQTKYETNLKEREIDLLQRENDITKLKASRSLGINFGLGGALLGIVFVAYAFYSQNKKKEKLNAELVVAKQQSDDLLLNILPEEVAVELKQTGEAMARQYNNVTVLFTDFVNFTGLSEQMSPTELVNEIHHNFTAFDAIMEKHGLEKIKTIGDAYLAVCGLPNESPDHAQKVTKAALDIREYMSRNSEKFEVRIGIHTGPVVAGIVGVKKYAYDIWGDTVNMASRMESTSEAGKINISHSTYELIKQEFVCTYRGRINAKNKGEVDMYFVDQLIT